MVPLGEQFPEAQFLITGVLGPQSNAHGPKEFLHIPWRAGHFVFTRPGLLPGVQIRYNRVRNV
jgi:hypothetical protein